MLITDRHKMVMLGISKHLSIRKIAKSIHKSIGTVQQIMKELEDNGYVHNPYNPVDKSNRLKAGRFLTPKGEEKMKKWNLLT